MSHEVFDRKVDGMICPQCEDEIAHRLLHTRGILSCTASYRKSTVTADFDPDILSAEDIGRILAETGYPVGDGRSGRRADAIALVLVACLYFAVPALTGLVKTPSAERGVGFGALFVIGLLTGVHCIGMCGGILLAQGNALLYNGGRLLSYTLMGAVFGALGKYISYDLQVRSMLLTVSGLLVVLIGLRMWGVPFPRAGQALPLPGQGVRRRSADRSDAVRCAVVDVDLCRLVRVVGKRCGEYARLRRGHVRLHAAVRPARGVPPEAVQQISAQGQHDPHRRPRSEPDDQRHPAACLTASTSGASGFGRAA